MKPSIKTVLLFDLLSILSSLPILLGAQVNPLYDMPSKRAMDRIRIELKKTNNDTLRMEMLRTIANYNFYLRMDSSIYYEEQALALARKLKLKLWEADIMDLLGANLSNSGNYIRGLQILLAAQKIAEGDESENHIWNIDHFTNNKKPETARLNVLAAIHLDKYYLYSNRKNREEASKNFLKSKTLAEHNGDSTMLSMVYQAMGEDYSLRGNPDSALLYFQNSLKCVKSSGFHFLQGSVSNSLGRFYLKNGDLIWAKKYILEGLRENQLQQNNDGGIGNSYDLLSTYFQKLGKIDSSLYYAREALEKYRSVSVSNNTLDAYKSLASLYQLNRQPDSAYHYLQLAYSLNDSLNNSEKVKQFQNIGFDELLKLEQLEKDKIELKNNIRMYSLIGGLAVFSIIAVLLYRNNQTRKKANELLQKQKSEIEVQKNNAEQSLTQLKSTQSLLIQSEKMASLGELTAGIAHEIQNPLNFVNNFSEVSNELLQELKAEKLKVNRDEKLEEEILNDISTNLEKITHHGKRAGSIVSGMLQHSRTSTGKIESTNINKLADEYLRLAFHGLRAKDKSFNADFKTDFDETIGNLNIVPQDMGRVILNLITNAFYAVTEKNKNSLTPEGGIRYQPMVTVSSRKVGGRILVSVKDNGNGIPQKIIDKIFQPFFTTKPTGQGTGLGLSLAYDIVKAHGGELKVETEEGKGSEFIIQLPIN